MHNQERLQWEEMSPALTRWVEDQLGSRVLSVESQNGGFSRGAALRLVGAQEQRVFLKAVDGKVLSQTAELYRAEASHLEHFASHAPVAHLLAIYEHDGWVGLLLEDIDGRYPDFGSCAGDLAVVLSAFDELAQMPAPSTGLDDVRSSLEQEFRLWERVEKLLAEQSVNEDSFAHIHSPAVVQQLLMHLPHIQEYAGTYRDYVNTFLIPYLEGDQVVHTDVRADNILVKNHQAIIVDWAWMCRGNAAIDSALVAVDAICAWSSVTAVEVLRESKVLSSQPAYFMEAVVVAMAGFYFYAALQKGESGTSSNLPLVRAQRAVALLNWSDDHRQQIGLTA